MPIARLRADAGPDEVAATVGRDGRGGDGRER